jgi:hypothetical protein
VLKKGSLQIELKGIFYFSFGRKKLKSVASFFYDGWEKMETAVENYFLAMAILEL